MSTPLHILKQYWNHTAFRYPQKEIIQSVLADKDTVALLPTGGGKSVCFQIPALLKEGVCIVISPLIALMQNQVEGLLERGIKATSIVSGSSQEDIIQLFDNLQFGGYKILYLSPERLQSKWIQEKIAQLTVSFIAVDEAHCISEWGHDFRPSYKKIAVLRDLHPKVSMIALTASATEKVLKDIVSSLQLQTPLVFKKSYYRDNLAYRIVKTEDKLSKIKQAFQTIKESGIVYVNSRKKTKEICNYLKANGFTASYYHGGLSFIEKEMEYNKWMANQSQIMVATNAFGMGIDKPDVRLVMHYHLPASVENYVQEAGRAGRNGKKAYSVVLTNNSDLLLSIDFLKRSLPTLNDVKTIHAKLYQYFQIALGEWIETEFEFDILDFCNTCGFSPIKTHRTLQILENFGIIQVNNPSQHPSTLRFLVNNSVLFKYSNTNLNRKKIIGVLMRMYGGLFQDAQNINEFHIAKNVQINSEEVIKQLKKLAEDQLVEYKQTTKNSKLFFLQPREDDKAINRVSKNIQTYLEQQKEKRKKLIAFIENDELCRSIQLLHYFGEQKAEKCGMCDVCKAKKATFQVSATSILKVLQAQPLSVFEIHQQLNVTEHEVLVHLRTLLSEEKVGITNTNKYYVVD